MARASGRSLRSLVVVALVVAILGSVFWLGSQLDGSPVSPAATVVSRPTVPASAAASVAAPPAGAVPGASPAPERPAPVALTDDDKQRILPAFYEAAAKDIERLEARLRQAREAGATAADISAMEEQLQKMHEIVRQTRLRHPGY